MNQKLLKGSKGLPETHQFAVDFPVPNRGDPDLILTTEEFDQWADSHGLYSVTVEDATLLMARNNLRKKINLTASSESWLVLGNVPFSIDVQDFGKTYKVQRSEDAFSIKADKLPGQVRQFATTKREIIQRLMSSIDLRTLPPIVQMRVGSLDREVERFLRAIDYQTTELNREYEAIRKQIQMMVDKGMISPESSGFAQILGPDGN